MLSTDFHSTDIPLSRATCVMIQQRVRGRYSTDRSCHTRGTRTCCYSSVVLFNPVSIFVRTVLLVHSDVIFVECRVVEPTRLALSRKICFVCGCFTRHKTTRYHSQSKRPLYRIMVVFCLTHSNHSSAFRVRLLCWMCHSFVFTACLSLCWHDEPRCYS